MNSEVRRKNNVTRNGKVKGSSAFNIQQVENLDEISWSNNKYESTYESEENKKISAIQRNRGT